MQRLYAGSAAAAAAAGSPYAPWGYPTGPHLNALPTSKFFIEIHLKEINQLIKILVVVVFRCFGFVLPSSGSRIESTRESKFIGSSSSSSGSSATSVAVAGSRLIISRRSGRSSRQWQQQWERQSLRRRPQSQQQPLIECRKDLNFFLSFLFLFN